MNKLTQLKEAYEQLGAEIKALEEPEFEPFWEPTNGEKGWYVDRVFNVLNCSTHWNPNAYKLGLVYKTEELAQQALDYQLAEQRLRKAVWNLNKGPAPKFIPERFNYTVILHNNRLNNTIQRNSQFNPDWIYFNTRELAEQLIESHSDDLMTYLHGV